MNNLSIETVLDVEYPGPPTWSADGDYLAATVYEDDGRALQFATSDGRPCWRFRPDTAHVEAFTWRPHGHDCLVATADERALLLDPAAENVRMISTAGDSAHSWSTSGSDLAFYRGGIPWVLHIETGETTKFAVPERGPYLREERMFSWSDSDSLLAYRFVDYDSKQIGVIEVETGNLLYRTDGPSSCHTPTWVADETLLFERWSQHATVREIVVVDPHTGEETVVIREDEPHRGIVSQGAPVISPTGDRFAIVLPLDGWDHLYVVDPETDIEQVTEGEFEDKGVADSTARWLDDSTLVFASNRLAPEQRGIYTVNVETSAIESIVETPGSNVHPAPSPDGTQLAYLHADAERSPEIRVRHLTDGPLTPGNRVTQSAIDDWPSDPVTPDRVVIPTEDDFEIPAFLIDPRETDSVANNASDLPALVWVHGGPMRQMRHGWHPNRAYGLAYTVHQYLARQGYVGLLVNYRGGIGYGKRFRQAIATDPGKEIDVDVVAAGEFLKDQDFVDSGSVAIWGLSYGGYATLRVLGASPDTYDLGINIAGIADYSLFGEWATENKYPPAESSWPTIFGGTQWTAKENWANASPITSMRNYKSPLYSFHGTADRYVNCAQQDIVVNELLEHNVTFEYEYYPEETHVFSKRRVWKRVLQRIESALENELGGTTC